MQPRNAAGPYRLFELTKHLFKSEARQIWAETAGF